MRPDLQGGIRQSGGMKGIARIPGARPQIGRTRIVPSDFSPDGALFRLAHDAGPCFLRGEKGRGRRAEIPPVWENFPVLSNELWDF